MDLRLSDPGYTERLASFLRSLGQSAVVAGPGLVELTGPDYESGQIELDIYLRVWNVLHPEAPVTVGR